MAVNAFRKSFFTWPACLVATENRIFRKLKSVWPKFYSFDLEMVLHFHFTFKPFPGHAQKRERAKERERERERERRESREPLLMIDRATRKICLPRSSKASIAEIVHRDRWDRSPKSSAEITEIARSTVPIAISPSRRSRSHETPRQSQSRLSADRDRAKCRSRSRLHADRDLAKHRADRSPSSNPVASLYSFFSQFDRIWFFFFSGFCLCFCIEKLMILYICLATEKMWATSRKCVFYGIFKNTTKHQKIFFETFLKCNQTHENIFLSRK